MKVLVACEESQRVCSAFRAKGHEAYSCAVVDCSGGFPEWHIKFDVLPLLNGNCSFVTCDGVQHDIKCQWDLIIAHPPCTYLTVTGNRWFNVDRYGDKALQRIEKRKKAIDFFYQFVNANCSKICIENPVGIINSCYRKPDQIIQPYMFGDSAEKRTCLWLIGLPNLIPTNVVLPPPRKQFKSGKSMPEWYANAWKLPNDERSKLRSMTFPGVANAMAEQWG